MSQQESARSIAVEQTPMYARSIARRGTITLGLIIGFYVLTIVLILALFAGTFALVLFFSARGLIPAAFTFISGAVLFSAIIPKHQRFEAPGPRITAQSQPRLFEAIADIAKQSGQEIPAEVYLMPQVNASVRARGGFLGIGRRKVLSIGLPLIGTLSDDELRAVLAHEFGHYYGGDTRFGPVIYKAHNTMMDVARGLSFSGYSAWLNIIMLPYVDIFLHITFKLSRYQEHAADKLAARLTGTSKTIDALRMVNVTTDIFTAYWQANIAPLIDAGFLPPILEGVDRFMSSDLIAESIKRKTEQKVQESKSARFNEFATHPPLAQRIAALEIDPQAVPEALTRDTRASMLIDDVRQLERTIFAKRIGVVDVDKLKYVAWEDICSQVYFPMWRQTVYKYSQGLAGSTPEMLPDIAKNMSNFSVQMIEKAQKQGGSRSGAGQARSASEALGSALTLALYNAGWAIQAAPGQPTIAVQGSREIKPFEVLGRLVSGTLHAEDWRGFCADAGILGINFGNLLAPK